ncbi:hypothetical protein [Paucisalibacillus globulus]|uniref:hypothetical protein n=1 Tax=Paucisalibacillus globulus TaxID=351095 RepID=UPI000403AEC9|nr:hypothetical protein [Paucisalibacillus globulus]
MLKYYLAVTFDVCEHNNLYQDMNEYLVDSSDNLVEKVKEFAQQDIAPVVKVYESDSKDFSKGQLYKEYKFKEFECNCKDEESM